MSLKKLFNEDKNLKSFEPLSKEDFKDEIESFDYATAIQKRDARFIAIEKFDSPSSFARFGSAEKYYNDSIKKIYNTYPYDGSLKEKVLWEVSSSLIDLYVFENGYPRTTGYAIFSTSSLTATDMSGGYGAAGTASYEYILTKGGPHAGTGDDLYYNQITDKVDYRKDANIYDLAENRESNLLIDGNKGNTVEFWLKKAAFDTASTEKEVIFDVYTTSSISSSADYGRLRIEISGHGAATGETSPFYVTYMSGTGGFANENIGTSITTSSIADDNWHHYSFRFKNTGSNTVTDLFVDGQHNHRIQTGTTVDYVSGALISTIGALAHAPSASDGNPAAGRGWAKLSGSVDEFRHWKTFRSSKKIQRYWFDQVGGGTNTDTSNTNLGVYYKFNEGITDNSTVDSTVLDYSGRISNGSWTGYSSTYSRNVGSAINDADILMTSFSGSEFRDPIIYSFHPDVADYLSTMKNSGSIYDDTNANSLISYIPQWMLQDNETENDIKDKNYLWNLLQIISSYFDEAAILLDKLPQLAHKKYYSGIANPPPFNKKSLESCGFIVPDIFINADLLEKFEDRDDHLKFEKTLLEVKNTIYQNIYNNLDFINKSKGTEKSFRNLFHCFGFGDDTLKFNLYGNNSTYKLEDNLKFTSKVKNYINFNEIGNSDASVYQYQIDSQATSFISGSGVTDGTYEAAGLAFTLETNVVLPNRVTIAEYATVKESYDDQVQNLYPLITESSLFGMHSAEETENDLTWASDDYANFQVTTVKDDKYSSNAYFKLTGTTGGFVPELTSSLFEDVYDDQLWSIAVTIEPTKYPLVNQVDGTADSDSTYTVQFYGVNYIADYKAQEFLVTGTMTNEQGQKFITSRKRVYAGAHRTNFTGSVLTFADSKINSCKAWMTSIPTGTIDKHNLKIGNYGSQSPTQNAFLYQDSINSLNVPESQTLALLWDFTTVTGSNTAGQFSVEDETSGSATDNRFGWFSDLVSRRHTASGSFFDTSSTSVVQSLERGTYQAQVPEVLLDSNLTRILTEDDEFFNRNTRPVTYHMSIEKNLFQDISEEMLNMFGSVVWFNNMIGDPVNVYRGEYKELKKAADMFFEKVDNDYDFDKYVEYFKFIDYAVSRYIVKLIPASMLTFEDGISTIIENFVLGDRNKFQNKYPIIKDVRPKEIVGEALGINELLYNWEDGHAPLSDDQSDNCIWWNERAERNNPVISSAGAGINTDRQQILDTFINETSASAPTLVKSSSSGLETYEGSTYVTRRLAKPYKARGVNQPDIHGGSNFYQNKKVGFFDSIRKIPTAAGSDEGALITIESPGSELESFKDCDDNLELANLKGKRKYSFSAQSSIDGAPPSSNVAHKGDMIFPFSLYSSSITSPSMGDVENFQTNLDITNLHSDTYGPFNDVPMQGPFTEKYVGGRPYRHVFTNFVPNDNENPTVQGERLEGWMLSASADALNLKNPSSPKSVYFRDGLAKRPVNIANIQQLTSAADTEDSYIHPVYATIIGNYSKAYEIVMTNGRSINNRYLAEAEGVLLTASADSVYVSGVVDYTLPRRDLTGSNSYVIVNRFAAPGDPSTMAEGMLDVTSGEYSVYNALPWRNLDVRLPLNELLRDHCKQFGYFSDAFNSASYVLAGKTYPGTSGSVSEFNYDGNPPSASFQKVNRNTRKQIKYGNEFTGEKGTIITASMHDNAFITHLIPQSDMQYAWITGNTENTIYGYEEKDLSLGDYASSDLQFVSASDFGGFSTALPLYRFPGTTKAQADSAPLSNFIAVDFVNLNTFIYDHITSSTNQLGSVDADYSIGTGDAYNQTFVASVYNIPINPGYTVYLNSLLLNRQGPWGGANWKLYRKDNHPIVRYQKNHNILGAIEGLKVIVEKPGQFSIPFLKFIPEYSIKNFTEPPITSKYKPLMYSSPSTVKGGVANTLASHGNIRSHFTDHTKELKSSAQFSDVSLDVRLPTGKSKQNIQNITYSPYVSMLKYLQENKDMTKVEVVYSETVYPKGLYTYLSGSRKRINFTNDFWRDSRDNRSSLDLANSMGESILTASIWKLDAHTDYLENSSSIPYSGGMTQKDGVGELQNCYSLFHYQTASDIVPAANYNRRIKLLVNEVSTLEDTSSPFYNDRTAIAAAAVPSFSGLTDSSVPVRFSASVGDTLWEASSSAGEKPFYDSYDDYAEEGFRNLKGGTVLPEFRISERMDDYVNGGVLLNYNNYDHTEFFNKEEKDNLKIENGLLSLTGSSIDAADETALFLERYAFSDFYKYFSLVRDDYQDDRLFEQVGTPMEPLRTTQHKLSCEAILKFLPYDGFYPAERTVQLAQLFSQSLYSQYRTNYDLSGDDGNLRTLMQPYFAPGILFNSIKSGIAVDYPIFETDSMNITSSVIWGNCISGTFDQRLNLTDLIEPRTDITIVDAEVDPDLALNSSASIEHIDNRYTFGISNFLAETVNMFIRKDNVSQVFSNSHDADKSFSVSETGDYTMDIVLRNSSNVVSDADFLEATASVRGYQSEANYSSYPYLTSSLQVNSSSITMYDRAITGYNIDPFLYGSSYGPPVHAGQFASASNPAAPRSVEASAFDGSSFDPFTPPHYNGYAKVRISVPLIKSAYYTLDEIMAKATYSYDRLTTLLYPVWNGSTNVEQSALYALSQSHYQNAMQLSASLFLGDENPNEVIYEREVEKIPGISQEVTKQQMVAFKTRWECPNLDFSRVNVGDTKISTLVASGDRAKGMWHQYGAVPLPSEGCILEAQSNTSLSLANVLEINTKQRKKIGTIRGADKSRQFSEAIIAIPFKYDNKLSKTAPYTVDKNQINLIKEHLSVYNEASLKDPSSRIRTFDEVRKKSIGAQVDTSVNDYANSKDLYDLLVMMRKYVIPPHLDFMHSDALDPFVMFMMEFSVDVSNKDLQNIWQNIEPTFAKKALKVKTSTNMHLMPTNIQTSLTSYDNEQTKGRLHFHPYFAIDAFNPETTRWAVFKVKKRASMNYNSIVGKNLQNAGGGMPWTRKDFGTTDAGPTSRTNEFLYSYNWPYDFFSLIELAKIDSITTFNPNYIMANTHLQKTIFPFVTKGEPG